MDDMKWKKIQIEETIGEELIEQEYLLAHEVESLEEEYLHHEDLNEMVRESAWDEYVQQRQQERRERRENLYVKKISVEGSRQIMHRSGIRYMIDKLRDILGSTIVPDIQTSVNIAYEYALESTEQARANLYEEEMSYALDEHNCERGFDDI